MKRLVIIMILLFSSIAYAHPGRTNEEGCHYCRTNCEQYGLQVDEYHCHNEDNSTTTMETTSSSTTVKTSSTTTSKKTTTTLDVPESSITTTTKQQQGIDAIRALDGEKVIEKDIYNEKNDDNLVYESDDYKARRMALYFFSFILILVIIKLVIRK